MGWLFYAHSKKDLIKDRVKGWTTTTGNKLECLAHSLRGNVLWTVFRVIDPAGVEIDRWIGCDLLGTCTDGAWGYKDMDESMHPYYYSCLLSYLDMVPKVTSEAWRANVREHHKNAKIKIKIGSWYRLPHRSPSVIRIVSLKPLRGQGISGVGLYKLSKSMLGEEVPDPTGTVWTVLVTAE